MRFSTFAKSAALAGFAGYAGYRLARWYESRRPAYDPCDNRDDALTDESFVFVSFPRPGERVGSHFTVEGGATTTAGLLEWRLRDRSGAELASGKEATSTDSEPEPFAFAVSYVIESRQIGQLEVGEIDAPDHGGLSLTNTIPVVLHPGPAPLAMTRR